MSLIIIEQIQDKNDDNEMTIEVARRQSMNLRPITDFELSFFVLSFVRLSIIQTVSQSVQIMANADEFCQFARFGQTVKIQKCLQSHRKKIIHSN